MARYFFLCCLIVQLSSTPKMNGSRDYCSLRSKVTVRWAECRPYFFPSVNSLPSNTTDVQVTGIIPTALEIIKNVSNLTFNYELALKDTKPLKDIIIGGTYKKKNNLIIFPCLSKNEEQFGGDDGDHNNVQNKCSKGKACFVKVTGTYGPAFLTKHMTINPIYSILFALEKIWKATVVTFLLAGLAGIVLWKVERTKNTEEFPKEFISGSWQGFWWAMVTMTTVGYGDKAPKSVAGRIVTICWMMIGMVFFSIVTGTMTGVLSTNTEPKDTTMLGKKVAVLADSDEIQTAMMESAHIVEYNTVADIFEAIRKDDIKFVLLDRFIVHAYLAEFSHYDFKVTKLIDADLSYFVFVISSTEKFSKNFVTCFKSQKYAIHDATQKIKLDEFNKWDKIEEEKPENIMQDSIIITLSAILGFLICVGVAWQYYYYKHPVCEKGTNVDKDIKMENHDSAYSNYAMKKDNVVKCLACRQCKHCNAPSDLDQR